MEIIGSNIHCKQYIDIHYITKKHEKFREKAAVYSFRALRRTQKDTCLWSLCFKKIVLKVAQWNAVSLANIVEPFVCLNHFNMSFFSAFHCDCHFVLQWCFYFTFDSFCRSAFIQIFIILVRGHNAPSKVQSTHLFCWFIQQWYKSLNCSLNQIVQKWSLFIN